MSMSSYDLDNSIGFVGSDTSVMVKPSSTSNMRRPDASNAIDLRYQLATILGPSGSETSMTFRFRPVHPMEPPGPEIKEL